MGRLDTSASGVDAVAVVMALPETNRGEARRRRSAVQIFAALIVSVALLVRDWVTPRRTPEILEIGTALLFGGLAFYAALADPTWSVVGVRRCVDIGLLVIVLISMAVGRPFTLG